MVGSLRRAAFDEKSTSKNTSVALVLVADFVQILFECFDVSQRFYGG